MPEWKSRQLLSSSAAADSGWFFVGDSPMKSIHFGPLENGGVVEIRGSNKLTIPDTADQEAALFNPFTSGDVGVHGVFEVPSLVVWIRFRKVTAGGVPETTIAVMREEIVP